MREFTCIESFCGAGGLGYGLHKAGFEIKAAFDNNPTAIATYKKNLSDNAFVADVRELTGKKLIKEFGLSRKHLDLFAGGPPCQGFSKQKKGAHLGDPRNFLILEYIRLTKELNPRFFILENVAMLGQVRGKQFVDAIHSELSDYVLYPHFYNTADYGVPQTRERFIIIGRHKDLPDCSPIPAPTHPKWLTIGEVIGDLPEPPTDYIEHPVYKNHIKCKISKLNEERFSYVPQGGGWQDIPPELRLKCHRDELTQKGGWPDVYGRLRWDGQAPTITGGFDSFTRGRYGHPIQNRSLTPREAARIQGFRDDFVFVGNRHEIRHQIGNAVPPPLAEAIGHKIITCLKKK